MAELSGDVQNQGGNPMKLVVGAAFALGIVLGGGQTLATNLVADEVSSVDDSSSPVPDDQTDDQTDEPTESADDEGTDEGTDESTDESTDDADGSETGEDPAESEDGGDDPAAVKYGHLVTAWLACVKDLEAVTDCGDRPHPPGVATGWDAAHAKDHPARHEVKEHPATEHASKGDHGKAHRH